MPRWDLAICILVLESLKAHRIAASVGDSYLHSKSVRKSIGAEPRPEELEPSLVRYGMPAMTPNSITTRSRLESELEPVRAEGVAVDNEENTQSVSSGSAEIENL